MAAPNWLGWLSWLRRERLGSGESPLVLVFTASPDFIRDAQQAFEGGGCAVKQAFFSDAPACFGGSPKPSLVLVDAGVGMQGAIPIDFIRRARGSRYRGPIIGCAAVSEVQREMEEAGATETCTPRLGPQRALAHLKLAA